MSSYELWYPYMTIPWTPFFTVVNILQDHYGFFLKPDKLCTMKTLESITGGKLNNDAFVVIMNSVSTLKSFRGNCDAAFSGAPCMNCETEFHRRRGWNRQKHIYSSDNWQKANCVQLVGSNSSNCSNVQTCTKGILGEILNHKWRWIYRNIVFHTYSIMFNGFLNAYQQEDL